jgi:L-alanine-DL-glutamate epimerase-like enolase superfamily enzyme
MTQAPILTKAELTAFTWDVKGLGWSAENKPIYDPNATTTRTGLACKLYTSAGVVGEYVGGGDPKVVAGIAKRLLGSNALLREKIYNDMRIYIAQGQHRAQAFIDILLWDIVGKVAGLPIYALLGGYRTEKLPAYAATVDGATEGWLSSVESFADYAQRCLELGVHGFKIHPYPWPDVRNHVDVVRAVGQRVGTKIDLMLDSYCHYRTFGDAVKVGRACDEMGYFWYEDPYHDGGITPFAYQKLRELIRTPLLMGEKILTPQERMAMVLAKATDLVRGDAYVDGITGTIKLAHAAESVGMDIELHGSGPPHRHLMAAIRNTNYYEFGWTHPDVPNYGAPVYADGYTDGFPAAIDAEGYVTVPQGPGLGVVYDWAYINAHSTGKETVQ